jgi:sodium-dependent phosphate cotransporter
MTVSFMNLGSDFTQNIIVEYTQKPINGLFIGILATAITQSSSLTTSIVVGLVATGFFPDVRTAVPIIIGTNIGTSVTSSIVSLAHISKKDEFHKAFSAGTLHDFFNLIAIIIILPLELMFGFLSNSALFLYDSLFSSISVSNEVSPSVWSLSAILKSISTFIYELFWSNAGITLVLSFTMLFLSLRFLSSILKNIIFNGDKKEKFQQRIFGSSMGTLFWGVGLTALVQSSSITTALTVPLVATNVVSLKKVFPFIMGANIGTTLTALIASLSTPNEASLTIALCHVLYNSIAVFIFMLVPIIQSIPISLSTGMGRLVNHQKWYGFAYIGILFFGIPLILMYFS